MTNNVNITIVIRTIKENHDYVTKVIIIYQFNDEDENKREHNYYNSLLSLYWLNWLIMVDRI